MLKLGKKDWITRCERFQVSESTAEDVVNLTKSQVNVNLVTFTEELLNVKLHFLRSGHSEKTYQTPRENNHETQMF